MKEEIGIENYGPTLVGFVLVIVLIAFSRFLKKSKQRIFQEKNRVFTWA